jgi:hypothetical protein
MTVEQVIALVALLSGQVAFWLRLEHRLTVLEERLQQKMDRDKLHQAQEHVRKVRPQF